MIRVPMALGYGVIGEIIHSDSSKSHEGRTATINPSKPCGRCKYYIEYNENQCTDMCSFGSAMYFPHVDGGFTRYKMVETSQCVPYSAKADGKVMVFAGPLAVAIHAARQAGELQGKRVFISGVGPIGCLIISAVKTLGTVEIIRADVSSHSLSLGKGMGADVFVNPQSDDMDHRKAGKGYSGVSFEVSGHPSLVNTCLEVTRARGVMVQVGMGGVTVESPMMTLISKEISLKGSLRFTSKSNTIVSRLANGVINPLPLLGAEHPSTDPEEVLRFAGGKTQVAKVQLVF